MLLLQLGGREARSLSPLSNMASAEEDMKALLERIGIPPDRAAEYAATLVENGVDTPAVRKKWILKERKEISDFFWKW